MLEKMETVASFSLSLILILVLTSFWS